MTANPALEAMIDQDLRDPDGDKIGKVYDIYLDEATGEPEWIAVHTGLFGTHVSFVPLAGAEATDKGVVVPFTKDLVKAAPHVDADGALSKDEEAALYAHYEVSFSAAIEGAGEGGDGQRLRTGNFAQGRQRPSDMPD